MKNICFSLIEKYDNIFLALAVKKDKKVILNIALSKKLINTKGLSASVIINQMGHYINAKGGGQPFFGVASGDNYNGLNTLFDQLKLYIKDF